MVISVGVARIEKFDCVRINVWILFRLIILCVNFLFWFFWDSFLLLLKICFVLSVVY
jgi:hypothetical protein